MYIQTARLVNLSAEVPVNLHSYCGNWTTLSVAEESAPCPSQHFVNNFVLANFTVNVQLNKDFRNGSIAVVGVAPQYLSLAELSY